MIEKKRNSWFMKSMFQILIYDMHFGILNDGLISGFFVGILPFLAITYSSVIQLRTRNRKKDLNLNLLFFFVLLFFVCFLLLFFSVFFSVIVIGDMKPYCSNFIHSCS